MRAYLLGLSLLGLLAGCSADWGNAPRHAPPRPEKATAARAPVAIAPARKTRASFASLPDRGDLIAYDKQSQPTRTGAYTWHAVQVSEAHALRAIAGGELVITAPNGRPIRLRYERHVEHPDGNWTWIGRVPGSQPGTEAILTFGEKAAFGSIPYGDREPLRMTIAGGRAWLVETDRKLLARMDNTGTHPRKPDHVAPPKLLQRPNRVGGFLSAAQVASISAAATTVSATTTVDVLLGYTSGFAARLGGQSQANTRLTFLVDVANQAFVNSQISARLRLVRSRQVSYPDATANDTALYELTGVECTEQPSGDLDCNYVGPPASLQILMQERDQYGADLVSLVRTFNDPENGGCGIAWLNGAGQSPFDSGSADYGMSVVSDSNGNQFPDGGYICRDESFAHEAGHNMGSAHDRETAKGDDGVLDSNDYGRYAYSFGYKTVSSGNFYTVMAYGDSGQAKYRVFSNPRITYCGGFACGLANTADNAQSLTQTVATIAGFRPTVVSPPNAKPNLYAIAKQGLSRTEAHVLSGVDGLKTFALEQATALGRTGTGSDWDFRVGDYNNDGAQDLYAIKKMGASGRTEIHVLNGASGPYSSFLAHVATALGRTGTDNRWVFDLGDYNNDGKIDVYAINRQGASGRTEVHVLNGADKFQSYLLHRATALGMTGTNNAWIFELGDFNGDGKLDIYAIKRMGGSGRTEIHVLNGADNFQTFLLHKPTVLAQTGTGYGWDFKLGDINGDSRLDLYAIKKQGTSGKTEAHVLNGSGNFQTYLTHTATALGATGNDGSWDFDIPVR